MIEIFDSFIVNCVHLIHFILSQTHHLCAVVVVVLAHILLKERFEFSLGLIPLSQKLLLSFIFKKFFIFLTIEFGKIPLRLSLSLR